MMSERKERRRVVRALTNIEAVVVSDGGVTRQPAKIRNVSAKGALVEVPDGTSVAGEVYLLLPMHQMQPCKPVWLKNGELGVSYSDDEH